MLRNKTSIFICGIIAGAIISFMALAGVYGLHEFAGNAGIRNNNSAEVEAAPALNDPGMSKKDNISTKPVKFIVDTTKEVRKVSPLIYGSNFTPKVEYEVYVRNFIRDTGITILRYPGGGSPGYHWKSGEFDTWDRVKDAPLSKIDKVIGFCEQASAELTIQVNVETGTPQEAAEWVTYINKKKGFRVTYWELGNEVYGDWDKAYMSGKEYAVLVKEYAIAMKAADPTIKIGANWGGAKYDNFDRELLKGAADYIDFVSYHWYPNHVNKDHLWKGSEHPDPMDVIGNTPHIALAVERLNRLIKEYAPHREGKIEMTFLEWDGSWDAPASDPPPYEQSAVMWTLANAIFYADSLGQFATHGVTVAAHYEIQAIMFGLIRGWDKDAGWGGQPWDRKTIRPKTYAIEIFSKHFGDVLFEAKGENVPAYYKEKDWWNGSYSGDVPYISCYASKHSEDGKLGIILINKHPNENFNVEIDLIGFEPEKEAGLWVLNGPDIMSQNDGIPGTVKIVKYVMNNVSRKFIYKVPAHSVNAIEIEAEKPEASL